jgi:hypothetical protein
MDAPQRETVIILSLIAGGSAAFAALSVGYIAHYDFGPSREEIRGLAVFGAGIIAALMATEYFGKKLRKP